MCNNGFGGGNCCWIIILPDRLWCCCGSGSSNGCGCGCGNNNGCGCNSQPLLPSVHKITPRVHPDTGRSLSQDPQMFQ